ncbi:hypothetical protein [Candidatus Flexifilum breve]|uniref:hypothetical protein n=1 Tax=Candidatus Flexifilum breve TaxID=3140694 RepID=UPI0031CC80EC
MKRSLWMITLIVLLAFPTLTFAQTTPAYINWIPADFDGFVRVSMDDPALALRRLNFGLFVAASLEWARFPNLSETPTLDQYFPLDMLDLETASFGTNVAPWLGDEVVIAYRDLNADFQADQTLMILPTYDSFTSAFPAAQRHSGAGFPAARPVPRHHHLCGRPHRDCLHAAGHSDRFGRHPRGDHRHDARRWHGAHR